MDNTQTIAVVGIIINAVSAIALLVTAIIMLQQTTETKRAANSSGFEVVYRILQDDSVRLARENILTLGNKQYRQWSVKEKKQGELVCCSFDSVGIMCKHKMISIEVITDSWGYSLNKTWQILTPMVMSYRKSKNTNEYWNYFEWLARETELLVKTIEAKKKG
jgi:hypothetical protein